MPYFGSTLLNAFYGPGPLFRDVDYDDADMWSDATSDDEPLWVSWLDGSVRSLEEAVLANRGFALAVLRYGVGVEYNTWR
jgi:hypothetical protein